MSLLKTLEQEPEDTDENGEKYLHPDKQEWLIGIDKDSTPFVLSEPNIHWSFFENGYSPYDLSLRGIPEDLDAGVYKMIFSFWSIPYDGYEQEADYGFDYASHCVEKSYA